MFSPTTVPKGAGSPQQCIFINKGVGRIGEGSSRFCIASKIPGTSHCGTRTHAANRLRTNKFAPEANHFYAPGAMVGGKPTAIMDPHIALTRVPRHLQVRFVEGLLSSKRWTHEIIKASAYVPRMKFGSPTREAYPPEGEDDAESAAYHDASYLEEPEEEEPEDNNMELERGSPGSPCRRSVV